MKMISLTFQTNLKLRTIAEGITFAKIDPKSTECSVIPKARAQDAKRKEEYCTYSTNPHIFKSIALYL